MCSNNKSSSFKCKKIGDEFVATKPNNELVIDDSLENDGLLDPIPKRGDEEIISM